MILKSFIQISTKTKGFEMELGVKSKCYVFIFSLQSISLPLGLALGSPIFPSGCEGKLGVALESLQGLRDLT